MDRENERATARVRAQLDRLDRIAERARLYGDRAGALIVEADARRLRRAIVAARRATLTVDSAA